MNNREIGKEKEDRAAEYLSDLNINVVDRNFNTRQGEIDIVALDNEILCFIEVKYRKSHTAGYPEEAVSLSKQIKLCKCARYYLYTHKEYMNCQIRFDVIAVDNYEIRYYRNAFAYIGDY